MNTKLISKSFLKSLAKIQKDYENENMLEDFDYLLSIFAKDFKASVNDLSKAIRLCRTPKNVRCRF